MRDITRATLRLRLRELDIKIIDLTRIFGISRPTVYKMIENYERGELTEVRMECISLFNYITQNKYVTVNQVQIYVAENILTRRQTKREPRFDSINKEAFIKILLDCNHFDCLLGYFLSCYKLLEKDNLNSDEKKFLEPLKKLYHSLGHDIKK
ncbi:hypothetical protein [Helicobacter muridarum]|uniref:Uncharacterized protein n=1 Tax=Helicobacter muridarum TaxID=216 RepID=A0A377PUF5_9HELI|nr:hypothetical protein [Helicobacter muridarum]STQ86140.1 Uncharacterised protein [Helicobacter muridarum]